MRSQLPKITNQERDATEQEIYRQIQQIDFDMSKDKLLEAHIAALSQGGDLNAPPGSRLWAIAVKSELLSTLVDLVFNIERLKSWHDSMQRFSGYRHLADESGQPFKIYEDFCKARPPFGLGCEPSYIDGLEGESCVSIPVGSAKEIADELIKIYDFDQLKKLHEFIGDALEEIDRD